ncbi:MAG TPA: sigma-54 dependent transcriptional regulator [Vicinamibacterales bacterium]|nr:sigma-54 dependent transcriptional regulator [Vicinamibacterales bacterium]
MTTPTAAKMDAPAGPRVPRILVVDDERSMRELLAIVLKREGYEVLVAENGTSAIATLEKEPVDILISDIKMPDLSGVDVLRAAKKIDQDILGIMMTAFASTETAVEAMRLGACDYLSKPFDVDLLRMKVREKIESRQLRQENVLLKRTLGLTHQFANIIGRSEAILDVFKMIETVAKTNSTILLTGESGTGKGLVAQAIHYQSLRRDRPHVAVNCGALPEALLESELFGHMRGAFTGADTNKKGLIEVADKGTVFLDEIGEMNAVMQVKLLRVLQERKFRRVGGLEEMQADIRVIAATNQDLAKLVADGRFREDLFYRINVIGIHLPPLRERREDIPLLAGHFLSKYSEQMGKSINGISHEAMDVLQRHEWPGNIRELENTIERAVALEATPSILVESLPRGLAGGEPSRAGAGTPSIPAADASLPAAGFDLEAHVQQIERGYLAEALKRAGGVQVKAAELLGMSFRSFRYYVKKYNLR